jgi:ABC-type sulfate/molybdate transport systems ATPase subunit
MDSLDIDIVLARRSFDLRARLSIGAETVALVGPSGAGKTSLLRSIAGLERPREGRITLGDELWLDVARGVRLSPERRRVGYQPQDYGLFPHLSVAGNIRFAARRERPDLLKRLGISHLAQARPAQLSGGERQRVALGRALAREPGVLLLDEPLSALDEITRHQVRTELEDMLGQLRLPTLLITHAFEDAIVLADRIGVVEHGRLRQLATPEELIARPADAVVAAHTGANVLPGVANRRGGGSIVHLRGGGAIASDTPADGPVQIAVHPWELELADPLTSDVVETITAVHRDRGGVMIRLQRFVLQVRDDARPAASLRCGAQVGLRVAPEHVRVLEADALDDFAMLRR